VEKLIYYLTYPIPIEIAIPLIVLGCVVVAYFISHPTKRETDGATRDSLGAGFVEVEPDHSEGE